MNLFGKYFVVIFGILCVSRTIPAIGSEEDDTGSMEVVSSVHHASTDDPTKPSEKLPKKMENESPVIGGASVWRSPYDSHMIGDAQHMRSGYVYELNDDPKVGASYNGVPLAHYNSRLDDDIKNFEPSFRSWDESMASFNDVDPNASLGKAPMSVETTPEKPAQNVKAPLPERDMSHLDIIAKARQMGVNAAKDSPKHHEKREDPKMSPVVGQAPAIQNPVVDITHLPRMTSFRTCGGGIAFRQIPEQLPQQFYRQQMPQQPTTDKQLAFDQRQMPQQQQPQQPMSAPSQQMPAQQMFDQRQLSQQDQQMPPAINQRQMMLMPGQQMPGQQMPTQQRFDHRQMPQQQPQITPAQQNQQMPGFEQRQMPQQQPMLMPTQEMPSQMPTQQAFDQRQMPQQQPGFEQRQMPQQQPMLMPTQEMPSQMPTQQAFDQRQMPQQQPGFEQHQMPQPTMFAQNQQDQQPESNQRQLMPQQPMQSPGSLTQPQQLWSIDGRQANPENTKTTDDQKLQKGDADEFPTDSSTKSDQRLATQEGPIVQPAALQHDLSKSEKKSDQLSGWEQDHQSITEQQKLDVQMRTQESSGGAAGNIDDVKLDEMKAAMEDMPKVGSPHFFKKKNKHGHGHGHSIIVVPGVYGGYAGGYASPSYSHYHYHTPSYPSYGGHSYGQSYGVPAYGHHGLHSAGHYHQPYGGYVGQQNPLENESSTLAQTTDSNRQPSFPESGAPVDKEMNIKLPKRFARTSLRVADDDDLKIDEDGMVAAASDDDFSVAGSSSRSRGCVCRSNDLGEGEDDEHVAAVPIELHPDGSHRISTGLLGSTVWSQPALRPYAGLWDPTGILGRFMKPTEPLYHSPPTVGIAYVPVQKVRSKSSKRPNPRTEYDEEYDHPQVGAARTNNQKRDEASLPNCIVRPEPIVGVPGEQESNQQVGAPQSLPVSGTIDQPAPLPNSQFLGLPQFMPLLGLPQFKPLPVPQLPQLPQWDQVGASQSPLITQPDATIDQQEPSPNSQLLGLPQFKPLPVLQLPKLPQLQPLPDPQLALTHLKSLPDLLGSILKPASELVGAAPPPPPCVPQGTGGDLVGQAQSDQRASALEGCIRGCLANSQ